MPGLVWSVTEDGHESAGYRIRRIEKCPPVWRLETIDDPVHGGARAPTVSVHPSLPAAKRRAERNERERSHLARVRGHIVCAAVTGLMCVALLVSDSFAAYVAAVVFLYIALRFLAEAIDLGLGAAWAWDPAAEGRERLSWSARFVLAATEHRRKRQLANTGSAETPAIIVLPPEIEAVRHDRPPDRRATIGR